MFSNDPLTAASANPSTRNPRRRQRTHSEENGVSLPKAKKRRSALTTETFVKPDANEPHQNGALVMNGTANKIEGTDSADIKNLPVREIRKPSLRGVKGDGSVILTKNEKYAVSKLVALPDALRDNQDEGFRGVFSESSYALAITPTQALVWPYDVSASSPETFVFNLPKSQKGNAKPLPLGSLVPASISSAEPGLVIVMPTTGKITYWESITSAAALDLTRQQRCGIEGSVGSMPSSESIIHLIDATPAGFILGFSSGRLALLSLRDAQGRPSVRVQFMQAHINTSGGLFSGLKNVFGGGGGGWRNDIVAVRPAPRRKREERDIGVVTAKGLLQIWAMNRGGHHYMRQESNAGTKMIEAIKTADPDLEDLSEEKFEVIDFAFVPTLDKIDESKPDEGDDRKSLLVLAVIHGQDSASYTLIEVSMASFSLTVGLVYPIRSYTAPLSRVHQKKPKLLLPRPPHTAFVVFDKAVVVASLEKGVDSPEQQLLHDVHRSPKAFEDVIDFREGVDIEAIGSGCEDGSDLGISKHDTIHRRRHQNPACIMLLKGVGVVRVTAQPSISESGDSERTGLSVKSKIEQAIGYGTRPQNPIEFSFRSDSSPSQEEVEEAALAISNEILRSSSKAVPYLTPSLEHQLNQRAMALKELATFVKVNFDPLSRLAKWKLLWDAEKLAAAKAIWKRYDNTLKQKISRPESVLLAELVDMLHERYKDEPNPQKGELDKVRHWFTKDIWRLDIIIPWAYNVLYELHEEGQRSPAEVAVLLTQADDVFLAALTTAFEFRQQNVALYGLQEEPLEEGLLKTEAYQGLPEFWTSITQIVRTTRMLTDLARKFAVKHLPETDAKDAPDPELVSKIARENPMMVQLGCQTYLERSRWCLAQSNDDLRAEGARLRKDHILIRRSQLTKLVDLGLVDAAIELSEKYADMSTLVDIIGAEMSQVAMHATSPITPKDQKPYYEKRLAALQDRFVTYFKRFGDSWATALFTRQLRQGNLASLLDDNEEWQSYLTTFLRANPAYAKLGWINEILGQRDCRRASQALLDVAAAKERDLWSKKVEMSIGKLASLAAGNGKNHQSGDDDRVSRVDQDFELIDVQEKLYQHVTPSIREALDEAAEIDLVKKDFGSQISKEKPALGTILEQGLTALVTREPMNATMLIDVLTLIDHHYDLESSSELPGQEFYLALRVAKVVRVEDVNEAELLERIIWRRCMIRDDWTVINDTKLKDDRAVEQSTGNTALFMNLKAAYQGGLFTDPAPLQPLGPKEVLGAGSNAAELRKLFPEDLCNPIAADLRKEDERLKVQMERGRLEHWFTGIMEAARKSVHSEAEHELDLARVRREVERRLGASD